MIRFTKVTYQNFLATGNVPITIDLIAHATTLIVGTNGAGKSTMSEAICFALFGKALRNINKPALVNSVNGRDCIVELEFTTVSGAFKVRRGIKPAIFEIYRNGVLEPVPANVDDYQETLESIIKLDYKSFKQVVILGSGTYVPFMCLSAASRRGIIEDLLDIEVFSSMNALAKEDLSEIKQQLDKNILQRKALGEQIVMGETFTAHLAEQNRLKLMSVHAEQIKLVEESKGLLHDRYELEQDLVDFADAKDAFNTLNTKQHELERTMDKLKSKAAEIRRDAHFYETHENCPECEQVITDDFKQAKQSAAAQKIGDVDKAIALCQRMLDENLALRGEQQKRVSESQTLITKLQGINTHLTWHKRRLTELMAEEKQLQVPVTAPNIDLQALRTQVDDLANQHNELSRNRVVYDAATMLLKDNGIKTKVIKHYLPIINKQINHYLLAMDFPILFTFDESFNESMKSRHRDDFVYESFSEGEKKRIDLALLLTWRAIAAMKNSASTNLLILDEVFDGSLDASGIEEFLKLMTTLEEGTNVFVISHRTDQLIDKFHHNIMFEKHKQFSRIK
jgi:DNA repair exonuclease SbcCD ATPase subunit